MKTIEYYHIRKKIAIVALGGTCAKCGEINNLQFDHINPATKEIAISTQWHHPNWWDEVLTKCQLLCDFHHKEKTKLERSQKSTHFTHGTKYAWMKKRCNCYVCLEAKEIFSNERNRKRRISNTRGPYKKSTELRHGENSTFYRKGCRCRPCKDHHAKRARLLRGRLA